MCVHGRCVSSNTARRHTVGAIPRVIVVRMPATATPATCAKAQGAVINYVNPRLFHYDRPLLLAIVIAAITLAVTAAFFVIQVRHPRVARNLACTAMAIPQFTRRNHDDMPSR